MRNDKTPGVRSSKESAEIKPAPSALMDDIAKRIAKLVVYRHRHPLRKTPADSNDRKE